MFRDLKSFVLDLVVGFFCGCKNEYVGNFNTCVFRIGEVVRIDDGVEYIAKRYWKRKGVVKSIHRVGDNYSVGLEILDRKSLLFVCDKDIVGIVIR